MLVNMNIWFGNNYISLHRDYMTIFPASDYMASFTKRSSLHRATSCINSLIKVYTFGTK